MQYTGTTFIDEIMKEIGENITNSNYRVFVLNWLQEAFDIAVAELEGHKFLNCVVDLNTVASTASYSAVSGSLIPGNIIAIRNKTTNRPLQYIDIQDTKFSTWDLESEGDPQYYYSYGYSLTYATSLIYFYPIPNAAYALEVTFKLESYQFADSSAVLYIPRYILSCLRFYVRSKAFQREGDSENSKFEMELFFAQLKRQQKSKHEIAKINQLQITDLPNYSRSNGNGRRENYQYGFIGESLSPVGVSSITIAVPTFMGESGSPLTSAGTITLTFDQQTGRKFLASPSDGTLGDVDFRALVANDIPTHTHLSADITDLSSGNEFADNVFRIKDNTDATKKISFQASGITTGTTRELTVQDASGTIALTSNKLSAFAATTSAELASVLSDETGTDKLVFNTSPTLVTPVLGAATATSINKVAITSPATSATLTIADGKTLTCSNTLTFSGTDSSSVAFGAGGTVVYTTTTQTLQNKTLDNTTTISIKDTLFRIQDDADATKLLAFQLSGITTANTRTLTVPNFDGTIATLAGTETLTNKTIAGASNTISGITEAMQTLADNTTNNASTSNHGYLKKLSNVSTEFMNGQGNWATPSSGSSIVYNKQGTATAVSSSITETDVYSKSVSIGDFGANDSFDIECLLRIDNTSGSACNYTIRFYVDGVSYHSAGLGYASGNTALVERLKWKITNLGSLAVNSSDVEMMVANSSEDSSSFTTFTNYKGSNQIAEDFSAAVVIKITCQMDVNNANAKFQGLFWQMLKIS